MKRFLITIFLFFIATCKSQNLNSTKEVNVLFIGNSLTYFYDMPQMLQMMLNETNPNIKIHQSTFPGFSAPAHLSDIITSKTENKINTRKKNKGEITETEKKIAEKYWDVIIIQTGTVGVLIPEYRDLQISKAIMDIKNKTSNPNCKFILFETWPLKESYPKEYCYPKSIIDSSLENNKYCSPKIENLQHEINLINESYDLIAKTTGVLKSENGNKFFDVLKNYPQLNLYEDESHPNEYGAFLNACIFYQLLTNNKAKNLNYNDEIEIKTAFLLKTIAE